MTATLASRSNQETADNHWSIRCRCRRVGRLGWVSPASPEKMFSDAASRPNIATALFRSSIALVRIPISAPCVGTRNVAGSSLLIGSVGWTVNCHAAKVVAVEALADIHVEFGFFKGSKDHGGLRARDEGCGFAGIQRLGVCWRHLIVRRREEIAANADNGLAPIAPMRGLLGVDANAAFLDVSCRMVDRYARS